MKMLRSWIVLWAICGVALGGELEDRLARDRDVSIRFLELKLQKEKRLVERGAPEQAAKIEGECLRHEIKCLERYHWYIKRERKLGAKAKGLAEAIAELKKKDAKTGLEDRKKANYQVNDLVKDPLSVPPAKAK